MSLFETSQTLGAPERRFAATERGAGVSPLHDFLRTYRGDEAHPRWHSDWAWDNYACIIPALAEQFALRRLCEIGGGRDPLFKLEQTRAIGLDYTINDIDPAELALAPDAFGKACFDIAGNLNTLPVLPGPYDLMVSRMVFEHVADVERAWSNIHTLLAPGGVALCFFPTLYAWPFTLNHIIPEKLSRTLLHAVFPGRADGGEDPKFPAVYDWCFGSERKLRPMLARAGFRDVLVQPFWGQHYLGRFPVLREIDAGLDRLLARLDWRFFTSYAYVIVRK